MHVTLFGIKFASKVCSSVQITFENLIIHILYMCGQPVTKGNLMRDQASTRTAVLLYEVDHSTQIPRMISSVFFFNANFKTVFGSCISVA